MTNEEIKKARTLRTICKDYCVSPVDDIVDAAAESGLSRRVVMLDIAKGSNEDCGAGEQWCTIRVRDIEDHETYEIIARGDWATYSSGGQMGQQSSWRYIRVEVCDYQPDCA